MGKMRQKPINVTEAELAVLEVLWNEGASTIRAITDAIYEQGAASEYATVQKLLDRLLAKGCVKKSKRSHAHTFTARMSRSDLIGKGLENLAEKLCSGSLTPLLIHLTEKTKLSKEDRKVLRDLINEA